MTLHYEVGSLIKESWRNFWQEVAQRWKLFLVKRGVGDKKQEVIVNSQDRLEDVEVAGRWYFKRDILDRLDDYFSLLCRFRSFDPETYALYRQIGAIIANPRGGLWGQLYEGSIRSPLEWSEYRPAFGGVFWNHEDNENTIGLKFSFFTKHDGLVPGVEARNTTIYSLLSFHSDKTKPNMSHPTLCYVAVNESGEIIPLKQLKDMRQAVRHKRGGISTVHHQRWGYPAEIITWARDRNVQPTVLVRDIFAMTMEMYFNSSNDIRVSCKKGSVVAAFAVDLLRTPYFFKDRDFVAAKDGRRKRIFHIVRTHSRKNGSVVRSHFRGARKFMWNGYDVIISMGEKHHRHMLTVDFGAHYRDPAMPLGRGELDLSSLGQKLSRHLEGQ